jgi:membrane fusion protein (multidrug efflux system)
MSLLPPQKLLPVALIAAGLVLSACSEEQPAQQSAVTSPPAVTVAIVAHQDVTATVTFNGRVEAVDQVELRARVAGFVEERLFEEGTDVKAGDLLIVLEKAPYEAQIGQVQGQITAAEGTLTLAKLEVDRKTTLVKRQAVAQSQLDQAEAEYAQALGELQRLRAALKRSQLDLSYTDIKAPIDGRISRFAFSVGDYVTPSSEPLAVIVSQDPMYVTFPVSARELLEVRRAVETSGQDPRAVTVKLRLPDGSIYGEIGAINFVDVRVDPTTDTVIVRATLPNPQRLLVSGQLLGVIVEQSEPEQALVIPQAAVATDQAGPYVLVVTEDSKAKQRRIRPGKPHGRAITVVEGLREGEQVIVEGLQKVRPGQVVAATPADNGV